MKRRSPALAAVAVALAAAVLAQPHARAVSSASPGTGSAAHDRESAQDAQNPDAVEITLSPEWGSVTGLAVDGRNNFVIVGRTDSARFPTTPDAADHPCRAGSAVLQVLGRNGNLLYSSCLGGDRIVGYGGPAVATAHDGSVWVVAETRLPTSEDVDTRVWRLSPDRAGCDDVFVGGPLHGCALAAGLGASVWMACSGHASQLATVHAWQPTYGGAGDVVVARFEPGRREAALLSYLGGPGIDVPTGIAVAPDGDLVVVGWTYGEGFPFVRPFQPMTGGPQHFFVARGDVSGRWIEFSSPFEVSEFAPVARVAVDRSGSTLVLAMANASRPPPTAPSVRRNPLQDAYLLELDRAGSLQQLHMIEPGFQTRVSPDESLYLHYTSVRADGSLLVVRTFAHYDSARSRYYDGGAIVSVLDRFGRAIREVELVELESGGGWVPNVVMSGPHDLYVAGARWDMPGMPIVVKRVGIGRADRHTRPPAAGADKR